MRSMDILGALKFHGNATPSIAITNGNSAFKTKADSTATDGASVDGLKGEFQVMLEKILITLDLRYFGKMGVSL